jgi:hypothetical protein
MFQVRLSFVVVVVGIIIIVLCVERTHFLNNIKIVFIITIIIIIVVISNFGRDWWAEVGKIGITSYRLNMGATLALEGHWSCLQMAVKSGNEEKSKICILHFYAVVIQ